MVKVKICGVTDTACVDALNAARPDYVGFVLSGGFRRSIDYAAAKRIRAALSPDILTVGVFVNERMEMIAEFIDCGIIQLVQLHGDEDEEYIAALKQMRSVPIIKAVGVREGVLPKLPAGCDYILLDAYAPVSRGGTGIRCEWKRYPSDVPIILAGGITPENVGEAISLVAPYAVDCSGGVETDGKKDKNKIASYVENAREADIYG